MSGSGWHEQKRRHVCSNLLQERKTLNSFSCLQKLVIFSNIKTFRKETIFKHDVTRRGAGVHLALVGGRALMAEDVMSAER